MITMVKSGDMMIPSISSEEALSDIDSIKELRDSLHTMLEVCLADDEVKFCIPSSQFYIVAVLIRELTRDIENTALEEKEEPPTITNRPASGR